MEDVRDIPLLRGEYQANMLLVLEGRLCQKITDTLSCCMPCPMTDWAYPDSFQTLGVAANWVAVVSTVCTVFLMLSWACLPVEKTNRHYLSICLATGVFFMNVSATKAVVLSVGGY
jgi:hypothetical protein